jgi:uncharacterized surface protein with fasciclin (FAS1) repeats
VADTLEVDMTTAILRNALLGVLMLGLAAGAQAGPKGDNLVDVARAANGPGGPYENQLNTLIAALEAADPAVVTTLSGNGQHTVFAPTDMAFAALGLDAGNIGSAFPQSILTDILLYHVANGRRMASDVTRSTQIRTLQQSFIQVSGTTLTDAVGRTIEIETPDVMAANGVIHVVNGVLLPFEP